MVIKVKKTNKPKINGMYLWKVTGAKANKYGGITAGVWARKKATALKRAKQVI